MDCRWLAAWALGPEVGTRHYDQQALAWLLVLRLALRSAISWSFVLCSVELIVLFEPRPYLVLNLLLAVGLFITAAPERRRVGFASHSSASSAALARMPYRSWERGRCLRF